MEENDTIYNFVRNQESNYLKPVSLEDGWDWSIKEHLRRSFLYKHSQFLKENENRKLRPFKNIVKPILNIQYRTEGFDVKDILLYVDNPDYYYKSFLIKKFHEKWAIDNAIDTFIDELVESYIDYGGALIRNKKGIRPDVVDLRTLAFCNQTDILAHPFGILHKMSPNELREKENWGNTEYGATISKEQLITLADSEEIDIYEIHGTMPGQWIDSEEEDVSQMQIIAFYTDPDSHEQGVTLYRTESKVANLFKLLKRDDIKGRALGWGGVEELFEPQRWTNFDEIQLTEMLSQASKTLYKSDDHTFKTRNNLADVRQGEVLFLKGGDISQLDTYPRNAAVFNDSIERWKVHAQEAGSASEGMLTGESKSGVSFKLFEAQTMEAKSMHHYRQGKIAVFIDEIYRDWIMPELGREIVKDQQFFSELSSDELQEVIETIVENEVNKQRNKQVLNGEIPQPREFLIDEIRTKYQKVGSKWFIKILKDEFKGQKIGISTNIAGKQKNLALLTDKIVNVLRQFISTPQIRQDPEMVKLLNQILESSGMSPIMFGAAPAMLPQQTGRGTEPFKQLGRTARETAPEAVRT